MVDTQHFCLRWNNYQSSITSAFENLRDDEDFVDVTLACDGKSLKAHRVVLSACSTYFRELLKSTPCKHPVIVLQDVAFHDLHALVEFIYHGEVNVHQRSLSSFLKTAEVLRVSGLTQQNCTENDDVANVRPAANPHFPNNEKQGEESFPNLEAPVKSSNIPMTVQQLIRRAQIKRNERLLSDAQVECAKRPRCLSPPLNNNDARPTDFSMVKNNSLDDGGCKIEAENLQSEEDNNDPRDHNKIKHEPLELVGNSTPCADPASKLDHANEDSNDSVTYERPMIGSNMPENMAEHDNRTSTNYIAENKLFSLPGGYHNFSMQALSSDASSLSDLNNRVLASDFAGSSQVLTSIPSLALNSLNSQSTKKLFTCPLCSKILCSKASLKRHVADKHAERQEEYRCIICERVYCSRNSLMTHIYTYHKSRPSDVDVKFC